MKKILLFNILIVWLFIPACDMGIKLVKVTADVSANSNRYSHIDKFAVKAQALLGGYEIESVDELLDNTLYENKQAFLESKPSVDRKGISVHSYLPSLHERASEYNQVWFKFKTPAAIDSKIFIQKIGQRVTSEKILELAFSEAREIVPEAAAKVDELGYTFIFDYENMFMGSRWSPSTLTIVLKANREIHIKTPTLVTNKFIPHLGGMNYCKVFTPGDAAQILVDLAAGNHDRIPFDKTSYPPLDLAAGNLHNAYKINWYGVAGDYMSQKAFMFVDKNYEEEGGFTGTCVINPGGFIPAISMRGLAKKVASMGYVVFIIKYPTDAAFWEYVDFRKGRASNLASIIKGNDLDEIAGLPSTVKTFYSTNSAPIIALGHSDGGAALGPVIFGEENPFDSIILYGVPVFQKKLGQDNPNAENVAMFFGTNEGEGATEEKFENSRNNLLIQHEADENGIYHSIEGNRTMQLIEGLSHFCIISDMTVGFSIMRERDGKGPAPSRAVEIFLNHLTGRGLL